MTDAARKNRGFNVSLLIVLHAALVIPLAYSLNIWADEASTLYATREGFWTAFYTAASEQKQAPAYFWILSLWRYLNDSIFFARLFSVVCSLLAIYQLSRLAARFLSDRAALLAAAFFALHPFLVWASLEIRVYSFVVLLSVLLIRLFYAAFFESDETGLRYKKSWFLIVVLLSLWTNYYLGFVIAGLFVVLVLSRKWRGSISFLLLMLIAGVAFFPLAFELAAEFASKTGGYQAEKSIVEGLRIIWNHLLTFVLPAEIFPGDEQSAFALVRVWIVRLGGVLLAALVVVKRQYLTATTLQLAALVATVIAFLLAAYFLVGAGYVEIRHAAVLFAPLTLLLGSLLSNVAQDSRETTTKAIMVTAGLLVLASFSYSILTLYPNMAKRGDWERVAEFIQQNESPGQPILVFTTFDVLSLPYYYKGVNRILPDENFFAFITPRAEPGTAGSLRDETDFLISEIPSDVERIWLAVNEKCLRGEACTSLQNYISANYTIEIEQDFYLERVYLLRRKQP